MTRFPSILLAVLLLAGSAQGQGLIARSVDYPEGPATKAVQTGWHAFHPLRQVDASRLGKTLADIESRMPSGHIYSDSNSGTWAHETTHGINSRIRVECGGGYNAFYCLNGWGCILREPSIRKSQVCQFVPQQLRGDGWSLYMAGQQDWDEHPLYICDEWVAYINGATVQQELYGGSRTAPDGTVIAGDVSHAVEFAGYASALLRAVDKLDPNYPDKKQLVEFVGYNIDRTLALTKLHPQRLETFQQVYWQGPCGPNGCGTPVYSNGYWQRPPVPPSPGTLVPVQPRPVTPPTNTVVKGDKGDAGAPGAKGDKGDKGDPGRDGKDGKTPNRDELVAIIREEVIAILATQPKTELPSFDVIAAEVEKRLKPITAEIYNDGKFVDRLEVPLGGTLPLERYSISK